MWKPREDLAFWMINANFMESCCRWQSFLFPFLLEKKWTLKWRNHVTINTTVTIKYFSERFFTRADLVQEEMEDTTAKLEKVNFMISGSRSNTLLHALPIWGPILPTIFLNVSIVMFLFCKKRSGWRRRFWNWQVCKISEDDVGSDREARHQVQYVKAQQRKLRKILSLTLLCWSEPIEFLAV